MLNDEQSEENTLSCELNSTVLRTCISRFGYDEKHRTFGAVDGALGCALCSCALGNRVYVYLFVHFVIRQQSSPLWLHRVRCCGQVHCTQDA